MNKRRIRAIIKWLRSSRAEQEHRRMVFDMTTFGETISNGHCKTACCIGGSALVMFGHSLGLKYEPGDDSGHDVIYMRADGNPLYGLTEAAGKLLGLEEEVAEELFCPSMPHSKVTPRWAARTLERLIETGEVNWRATARGKEKQWTADADPISIDNTRYP